MPFFPYYSVDILGSNRGSRLSKTEAKYLEKKLRKYMHKQNPTMSKRQCEVPQNNTARHSLEVGKTAHGLDYSRPIAPTRHARWSKTNYWKLPTNRKGITRRLLGTLHLTLLQVEGVCTVVFAPACHFHAYFYGGCQGQNPSDIPHSFILKPNTSPRNTVGPMGTSMKELTLPVQTFGNVHHVRASLFTTSCFLQEDGTVRGRYRGRAAGQVTAVEKG